MIGIFQDLIVIFAIKPFALILFLRNLLVVGVQHISKQHCLVFYGDVGHPWIEIWVPLLHVGLFTVFRAHP